MAGDDGDSSKPVSTLLEGQQLRLRMDDDYAEGFEGYEDFEVDGARSSADLVIGDLAAGAGLLHIIDDVLIPA